MVNFEAFHRVISSSINILFLKGVFLAFIPLHAPLLHNLESLLLPTHALPPFLADMATVLVISCNPLPQVLEHDDH